jgi:4-alpha-glucanotransferase
MSVLQFAFADNPRNSYLPHNHQKNQVVYSGTHDNNTSIGWFNDLDAQSKSFVQRYLNISGELIGWDLFRTAVKSVADISMVPLQDLMSLGCTARLNNPGTAEGNWNWRYQAESLEQLETESQLYLKELLSLNGR